MNRIDKRQRKKGKSSWLIFIFILVIIFGIYLGYSIQTRGGGLQGIVAMILGQNAEELENLDTITVLLLRCE